MHRCARAAAPSSLASAFHQASGTSMTPRRPTCRIAFCRSARPSAAAHRPGRPNTSTPGSGGQSPASPRPTPGSTRRPRRRSAACNRLAARRLAAAVRWPAERIAGGHETRLPAAAPGQRRRRRTDAQHRSPPRPPDDIGGRPVGRGQPRGRREHQPPATLSNTSIGTPARSKASHSRMPMPPSTSREPKLSARATATTRGTPARSCANRNAAPAASLA